MKNVVQYQIYIGFNDSQFQGELVTEDELTQIVSSFFEDHRIDFSVVHAEGGFLYADERYVIEHTLVITIIGQQALDIIKLSQALSMYMNQECLMITKTYKDVRYR